MMIETTFALDGRVAIIRLTRARALNALNGDLLDELDEALDSIATQEAVRVAIITGTDSVFSVGADLKEQLADRGARIERMHRLVLRLAGMPVVSIAAIEGWALGGGLELAMACTFRAASPTARLGLPEIRLGVVPAYGGTQLAPRLVGSALALELMCLGEPIDAARAERIGLINWLADDAGGALALALDRAAAIAERSLPALQAARQAVRDGERLALPQALALEAQISAHLLAGDNPPDAAASFLNRAARTC
ncbi:enoyl-CoA hydratase/isomerase family protein [Blastomonas sp.]|uniref:enoyl-CoA hydratase/isomerase family protein n=1 Tax=Blastomonas sp. TaxID=1909299 RepID=UPI00406A9B27